MDEKLGLIFDMDGTLWDSSENVAKSWTIANEKKGYKRVITTEDMQNVMGKTMTEIAEIIFPDVPIQTRMELLQYSGEFENEYLREHGGNLYPDLEETLKKLKEKYHLYIVSNCQSGYIEAFLDYYQLWDYFEDKQCFGDNGLPKGQNIRLLYERNQLDDAAYVGDIQGDYDATMEAGLAFIHAAYGFGKINHQVPKIQSFSELVEVADRVLLA